MPTIPTDSAVSLTLKQEAFCREYLTNGGNASDAYRHVYDTEHMLTKSIWEKASVLLSTVKVRSRLKELTAPIAAQTQYDLLAAMKECDRALALAEEKGESSAMTAAIKLRAHLNGLLIDRKEVKVSRFDDLSAGQRQDALAAVRTAISKAKAIGHAT